jgi:hypothetical protein
MSNGACGLRQFGFIIRLRQIGYSLLKLAALLEGVDNFVGHGEYYSTS